MDKKILEHMERTDKLFCDGVFGCKDNKSARHLAAVNMAGNILGEVGFVELGTLVERLCELALFGKDKFNEP